MLVENASPAGVIHGNAVCSWTSGELLVPYADFECLAYADRTGGLVDQNVGGCRDRSGKHPAQRHEHDRHSVDDPSHSAQGSSQRAVPAMPGRRGLRRPSDTRVPASPRWQGRLVAIGQGAILAHPGSRIRSRRPPSVGGTGSSSGAVPAGYRTWRARRTVRAVPGRQMARAASQRAVPGPVRTGPAIGAGPLTPPAAQAPAHHQHHHPPRRSAASSPGAHPAPGRQPGRLRRDPRRPGPPGVHCHRPRGTRRLGGAAGGRRRRVFPGHGGELRTGRRRARIPRPGQHSARAVRRATVIDAGNPGPPAGRR
jgi:hypothetical protein